MSLVVNAALLWVENGFGINLEASNASLPLQWHSEWQILSWNMPLLVSVDIVLDNWGSNMDGVTNRDTEFTIIDLETMTSHLKKIEQWKTHNYLFHRETAITSFLTNIWSIQNTRDWLVLCVHIVELHSKRFYKRNEATDDSFRSEIVLEVCERCLLKGLMIVYWQPVDCCG